MSHDGPPPSRHEVHRSLSSILHGLDGPSPAAPTSVDLGAALVAGGRLRRRRGALVAVAGAVATAAVLGLGHGFAERGTGATPIPAAAAGDAVTGSVDGPTRAQLLDDGYRELPAERVRSTGATASSPASVFVDGDGTTLVVVLTTDACHSANTLEAVSQTADVLELRYLDPDAGRTTCPAAAVHPSYRLELSTPVPEGVTVLLDLPGAPPEPDGDVPGRAMSDLDPGEAAVATSQVVMTERSTHADGSSRDQLFVDAAGTGLRLRFAFSICASAVIRPPVETADRVDLQVVITDPGTGCIEPFYAEDLVVTLDAPLGDRQVVVTEETRIDRDASTDPAWRDG